MVALEQELWLKGIALRSGLIIGLLFAAEYFFMAEGLRYTSAAHMAVFLYTSPIFAAIGLHIFLPEERLTALQWLGIALAFFGIAITFLWPSSSQGAQGMQGNWLRGDFLGICAGLSWGLTTIVIRTTRLSDAPAGQTLFIQLLYAFILLSGLALITDQLDIQVTAWVLASMSFQIFIVCFIAMLTWFWLLRTYFAAKLGVLLFMTPIFGVAFGVLLLNEPLSFAFVLGSILVLLGLLVVNHQAWRPRRKTLS